MGHNIGRRAAIRILASSMALPLLAACTPSAPTVTPAQSPTSPVPTPATSSAPNATDVAQPKSGGTLPFRLTVDPSSLDGHLASPAVLDTVWMAYDTLTRYDDKLHPQPMLAESWDLSSNGTQLEVR